MTGSRFVAGFGDDSIVPGTIHFGAEKPRYRYHEHRCALCGHVDRHPNEAELRRMANEHAETHAEVTT